MASADHEPAWLSEDGETTPLMGTGKVSLQDPEIPPGTEDALRVSVQADDLEETAVSKVLKSKKKKRKKSEDWHEDDETASEIVVTVRSPTKNWFLHFFHWFEAIAIISCLGILITQILPLVIVPLNQLGFLQSILRIYISLFSIIFILVELRVPWGFLRKAYLLQTYFSRGLLYTFLGVIGMEEAYSGRIDDMVQHSNEEFHVAWAPLFMQISSWFVFGVGSAYMIFGVCCLQLARDKLEEKHKKQVEEYKKLEQAT